MAPTLVETSMTVANMAATPIRSTAIHDSSIPIPQVAPLNPTMSNVR
jgi:hypothetical protein